MDTVVGWRLGLSPVGDMQSPRPRWPARPRGILDELTQWQGVGWIYWLDLARSISFWCAFIENCSPLDRSLIHASSSNYILFFSPSVFYLLAFPLLFWLGSAADHRSRTHPLLPFFNTHGREVQTAVGWVRYMLLEWEYTIHRGGITKRNCRRRGVTLGYTKVLEKGPEFGDEAE